MLPLSLVIITFNEEKNIETCIASARDIASEILVLDSFSTDRTREIATNLGARVVTHEFDGHIQQKNRAKNMATNDWVLSLDADERLSPELQESIRQTMEKPMCQGYTMNRLNHYCGKPIKTCGWYPDRKLRLWRKSAGDWQGSNPHDKLLLHAGKPGFLTGDILHFTYADKAAMLRQVDKFARISALQNQTKTIPYLVFKMLLSSSFKWVKTYVFQLGFKEGKYGWDICYQQAREVFLKYYLAIQLKKHSRI